MGAKTAIERAVEQQARYECACEILWSEVTDRTENADAPTPHLDEVLRNISVDLAVHVQKTEQVAR